MRPYERGNVCVGTPLCPRLCHCSNVGLGLSAPAAMTHLIPHSRPPPPARAGTVCYIRAGEGAAARAGTEGEPRGDPQETAAAANTRMVGASRAQPRARDAWASQTSSARVSKGLLRPPSHYTWGACVCARVLGGKSHG